MQHYPNAARVRLRSCDTRGDKRYFNECKFPFYRDGQFHNDCIPDENDPEGRHRCFYEVGQYNIPINLRAWGYCIPEKEEVVPRSDQKVTILNEQLLSSCAQNYHHLCEAHNMYGGISIDWENGKIELSNFAPSTNKEAISTVTVHFTPEHVQE